SGVNRGIPGAAGRAHRALRPDAGARAVQGGADEPGSGPAAARARRLPPAPPGRNGGCRGGMAAPAPAADEPGDALLPRPGPDAAPAGANLAGTAGAESAAAAAAALERGVLDGGGAVLAGDPPGRDPAGLRRLEPALARYGPQ